MAKKSKVVLPVAPLADLIRWWQTQDVRGIIIGGLAVSLLCRPRVTRDVDGLILLPEDLWSDFLDSGRAFGFLPRESDTLSFAHEARVLLLRHGPSGIDVDIALGGLPFEEEAVARATTVEVAGISAPLATPEDLVTMKAIAQRERDWLDIEALLTAYPQLDLERVRHWVRSFAEALEAPELYLNLDAWLARRPPRKKTRKKGPS